MKSNKNNSFSVSELTVLQAEIFKAISYPTRLEIVKLLDKGPLCVCEIVEALNLEYANASRHLSKLANAGIVKSERKGTNISYSLECNCILGFLNCLTNFIIVDRKEKADNSFYDESHKKNCPSCSIRRKNNNNKAGI